MNAVSQEVWKFRRYNVVMEYELKPDLPEEKKRAAGLDSGYSSSAGSLPCTGIDKPLL